MEINKNSLEISFKFLPKNYILVRSYDPRYGNNDLVWTLNHRIDRSYKGKSADIGNVVIYLEDEEANKLKRIFDWTVIN